MRSQRITEPLGLFDFRVGVQITDMNHMPSWKRWASKGLASFSIKVHKVAGVADIDLVETSVADSGKEVRRETMMSLSAESAKALYDVLHSVFGDGGTWGE